MSTQRLKNLTIKEDIIQAFCFKWKIKELAFFGSVLREDFNSKSDVDILVSFLPESHWSLFEYVDMKEELESIFGRNVDFISRTAIEMSRNNLRKHSILDHTETIYVKAA